MPNVIAIFPGKKHALGGCEIYRTTMPFHHLTKKHPDWKTEWSYYEELHQKSLRGGQNFWRELAIQHDLFVFPRIYFKEPEAEAVFKELVWGLNKLGKHVIYEVDDDLTNDHRYVIDGDAISCASCCEAVTVTTPYLGQVMTERTGKKSYVLPNMYAPEVWSIPGTFRLSDKLTIGLTGSSTHKEDWRVLANVLPELVKRDDVHLVLMGFHPDYLSGLPNTSYMPGILYEQYAQVIQGCDIIIGAVNNDPFNLGKSSIKIVEGMAARRKINNQFAGAATIATNHPIYNSSVEHEKTGLLVEHTEDAWRDGLTRLIEDRSLRLKLQLQGHEWVGRHHDISKKATLWKNAYEAVLRTTPS